MALLSLLNNFYSVIKVHLMYLKDIIRGGISMKKLYLFIIPIISYILAYIITGLEDQIPLYSESDPAHNSRI